MIEIAAHIPQRLSCKNIECYTAATLFELGRGKTKITAEHCRIIFLLLRRCLLSKKDRPCHICSSLQIMSTGV